ncbi:hypothetical protein [Klebsiella quasipneumoniae]|uniref:hypothetical protein n=1 Tax=Klebsiella quasipneumoniae TaxID=1463165 RepID=UPI0038903993
MLKRKNKKLSLSTELSALFDAWQFMAGVLPPPSGPLLRNVQIRSPGFVLLRRALTDRQQIKQKAQSFDWAFCFI